MLLPEVQIPTGSSWPSYISVSGTYKQWRQRRYTTAVKWEAIKRFKFLPVIRKYYPVGSDPINTFQRAKSQGTWCNGLQAFPITTLSNPARARWKRAKKENYSSSVTEARSKDHRRWAPQRHLDHSPGRFVPSDRRDTFVPRIARMCPARFPRFQCRSKCRISIANRPRESMYHLLTNPKKKTRL